MAGNDQQHPPPQGAPKGAHAPKTPPKMPPKVMPLTPKVMQPAPPMPAHDGPMPSAGHVAPSGEQAAAGGGPQGQGQCPPKWFSDMFLTLGPQRRKHGQMQLELVKYWQVCETAKKLSEELLTTQLQAGVGDVVSDSDAVRASN